MKGQCVYLKSVPPPGHGWLLGGAIQGNRGRVFPRLVFWSFSVLAIATVLELGPPSLVSAAGLIPGTFPVSSGSELEVKDTVTVNGQTVSEGKTGSDSVIQLDGTRDTVNQTLPSLEPPSFPANSSNTDATDANSPFVSSTEVFYKQITIGQGTAASFDGGGPFHIDELKLEEDATVSFAAGTYFLDALKMDDKRTQLFVTSEPVILHIGKEWKLEDEEITVNAGGSVTGLRVFLHDDAEVKGGKGLEFTGLIYGPDAKKVELKEDVIFRGAIIIGGEIKLEKDIALTYTTANQAAVSSITSAGIDGKPPVVTVPADLTRAAVDANGTPASDPVIQAFLNGASAVDDVDGSITPTNDGPGGFPLGATVVTFSATDVGGNTGTATATVTVLDLTPPVVTAPGNITVAADDNTGTLLSNPAILAFLNAAAALDNVDGPLISTHNVPPVVPLGLTVVTFSATDSAGNTGEATATISVNDITPPEVNAPTAITVEPVDSNGIPATDSTIAEFLGDATAWDNVDGFLAPTNNAPSVFPSGTTTSVTFSATDQAGNNSTAVSTVTVNALQIDSISPTISFLTPSENDLVVDPRPVIDFTYNDEGSGINVGSLTLSVNGNPLAVTCSQGTARAQCTPTTDLPQGSVVVVASIEDQDSNANTAQTAFTLDTTSVDISILTPADGTIVVEDQIQVTGTVGENVVSVSVSGVVATLDGNNFEANVPLREGTNMIVAVGTRANGKTGTDFIDVTRDIVAPMVRIDSPRNGFVSFENTIAVVGQVKDFVNGATDAQVFVNGIEATVADGGFMVMPVPLVRGPNTIEVVATDSVGNEGRHEITVTFQQVVGARIGVAAGNGQEGVINEQLVEPLTAVVQDELGNPIAGRIVTFQVTRNSGHLKRQAGDPPKRMIQVPTNGSGQASVLFTLGNRAGEGNNRVKVTAQGAAGEVEFCASARGDEADRILLMMGDNQRGLVGHPLPTPLEIQVVDQDGNPVKDVPVTFTVLQGSGNLNGEESREEVTGSDGLARAILTLGQASGLNNNIVEATFDGLTGLPATFTASGLVQGNPADTTFSGIVMDNGHTPIPGAVVTIPDTTATATTDEQGQFLLTNVPVGHIHLHIDPTNSPRPETFPPLEFETVTVAGQENILGQPILLPELQTESSRLVGGNQDVTLTMPGVEGLELTVFANSVTCPDGSSECQVSISQVHLDKVPMPPPGGRIFNPAWTIQPAGTKFNPPAQIKIPNKELPPGQVTDVFQFDHALNMFIAVAKGTVTEDGALIVSDPGFGITRAGWGGDCPPPIVTTTATNDANNDGSPDDSVGPNVTIAQGDFDSVEFQEMITLDASGSPGGGCWDIWSYSWETDDSEIISFETPDNKVGGCNPEASHSVRLKGLKPGTTKVTVNFALSNPGFSTPRVDGAATAEIDVTVSTKDTVVIGWIKGARSTDGQAGNPEVVAPGANFVLKGELNGPLTCPFQLALWSVGFRTNILTDEDRRYANAFLVYWSANGEPPRGSINPEAELADGDFRAFNRWKAVIRNKDGMAEIVESLQSETEAGVTPDPCNFLLGLGASVFGLDEAEEHPNSRPAGPENITASGTKVYQHVSLRLGSAGQLIDTTLNNCIDLDDNGKCDNVPSGDTGATTPWIWSIIKFDTEGVMQTLVGNGNIQIFPTYTVYEEDENGILQFKQEILQAPVLEEFIGLDSDSEATIPPTD